VCLSKEYLDTVTCARRVFSRYELTGRQTGAMQNSKSTNKTPETFWHFGSVKRMEDSGRRLSKNFYTSKFEKPNLTNRSTERQNKVLVGSFDK